jgi:hypothetical protein
MKWAFGKKGKERNSALVFSLEIGEMRKPHLTVPRLVGNDHWQNL